MTESILPADWTAGSFETDGTPGITTAMAFYSDVDGAVSAVTFPTGSAVSGNYTGGAWRVDASDSPTPAGTELGITAPVTSPATNSRVSITFDPPVAITAGVLYRFGVHNSAGRYAFKSGDFSSGKTSAGGNLHAPANGGTAAGLTIAQASFSIGASIGYPANSGGGNGYGIDVIFTPDTPPNEGSTDTGLQLTLAGVGETPGVPPSEGAAGVGLALAVAVTGQAPDIPPAEGASASALVLTLAGQGVTPPLGTTDGQADVRLNLSVSVHGRAPVVAQGGSWASLLNALNSARADHELNEERKRNPVECPEHGWPLQDTPRGKHCLFGGHIVPSY